MTLAGDRDRPDYSFDHPDFVGAEGHCMYEGRFDLQPGDPGQLGSYRILRRLGSGGMGTVFLAEVFGTGKQVAVKMINPAYSANRTYRRRFVNEFAATSRVSSPYTARVLDAQLDTDPLYIVTEYVRGHGLGELVTLGQLAGEKLVGIAKDTARALSDIHSHDIVHRDLKPSNVIVAEDRAVLIDFGIAARVDEIGELTSTGKVVGSLPYLAPELLFGHQASAASDVYSWGCVVYYAATGRAPFSADLRKRTEDADVRPVPGVVRDLVARALANETRDRPSVAQILFELDSVAAKVVLSGADGSSYAARLRDFLVDAGFGVRISSEPDTLAGAAVLITLVSDRPSRAVTDMRAAARRLGLTVLPVVVGSRRQPDPFLDARAGALPDPAHLRTLRELTRARVPTTVAAAPEPVLEPVRVALARRDLVAADQLTTALLLDAAGCAEAGWVGKAQVADVETAFLRDCARVWYSETDQRHGFLAQRKLADGLGRCDMGTLARTFGWGEPRSIPSDYHAWVAGRDHAPGFFPTLRAATATRNWYDRWSMTVSAVHQRIWKERL